MYDYMKTIIPQERILFHEPMSRHTTFRVGGEAEYFVMVRTEEELTKLIFYLNQIEEEYFILGNGSNLLVGDKGYRGVVLKLDGPMEEVSVEGNVIRAGAGALLSKVAAEAKNHGLSGMEFAAGIPGSIGGGVVMNAGAYGGEMKQVVVSVRGLDTEGQILLLDNETMEFGYRTSAIKNRSVIVLEVTLRLTEGNPEEIGARMEELALLRRSKQPLEYPSAGSTFKRPEGYYAGKLIMEAGMRGYRIGGAQVSDKHCGFVVNTGKATAADIREVIEEVQQRVKERFHVSLEPEIIFLGDFYS
ncbi:MAG: UDP-N-acetylmuramate dehydrogenase [Lachnospiraceae bacterium]|nr:UDP-N-acetylmuramate dehydrogenase [Lachnospiraceae bacterium]